MNVEQHIMNFICDSKDAYAVFSPDDKVIYCNDTLEDLFCFPHNEAIGKSFRQLIMNAYEKKQGIAFDNIETTIEEWLIDAQNKRRQRSSRMFEVDLIDGRWMLVTEQLDTNGYVFLQAKNITRQKILENQLNDNLSKLNDMAMTDELTQIPNRRSFITNVNDQLNQKNEILPHALIAIDIDDFKSINDNFGHTVGDIVLKEVAKILQQTIRPYDFVGRIGGEEFSIFLHNVDYPTSVIVGNRVIKNISETCVERGELKIKTTISAGLAWANSLSTFETLYEKADEKLYESKMTGKNKLSSFKF